jgi:hypothetical protein
MEPLVPTPASPATTPRSAPVANGSAVPAAPALPHAGGKGGASEPGDHTTQRLIPSLNHNVRPDTERRQRTPR